MKKAFRFCCFFRIVASFLWVSSQDVDEDLLFQEIPSVFSASKYKQKVTEDPASGTFVTAEEMRRDGFRTLTGIHATLPDLYVSNDHHLGFRSFSEPTTTIKWLHGKAFRAFCAPDLFYQAGGTIRSAAEPLRPETIAVEKLGWEQNVYRGSHNMVSPYWYQANAARHMGKLLLNGPLWLEPLFVGLVVRNVGSRHILAKEQPAGRTITDLTLNTPDILCTLGIDVSVYNFADKTHHDPGFEEQRPSSLQQNGRTWRL